MDGARYPLDLSLVSRHISGTIIFKANNFRLHIRREAGLPK